MDLDKLRRQLIIAFLMLSLTPLITLGFIVHKKGVGMIHDGVTTHLESIVNKDAHTIEAFLGERIGDPEVVGTNDFCRRPRTTGETDQRLRLMQNEYKVYREIFVVDKEGTARLAIGAEKLMGKNFSGQEWFRAVLDGKEYVSDVLLSEAERKPILLMSIPLRDSNGKMCGAFAAHVDFQFINNVLKDMQLGQTGEAYLVNRQGYFLTTSKLGGRILEDKIPMDEKTGHLGMAGLVSILIIAGRWFCAPISGYLCETGF